MAVTLDPKSVKMTWKTSGAAAACHPGTQFALLHCTKGANLGAGDRSPAGKIPLGRPIDVEATAFWKTTAKEFDLGDRQIGMVQTSELLFYEYVFAGRRDSEGSCRINMKAGFTLNPSLDVDPNAGQSVDDEIFSTDTLITDLVKGDNPGLKTTLTFNDHPNNAIPYRFTNKLTGARNYLALAARAEKFNVHFVTRASPSAPIEILGRFNWAVDWVVEFSWKAKVAKPSVNTRRADILDGVFTTVIPSDASANISRSRTQPFTNKQDEKTSDAVYKTRKPPLLFESRHWPDGFRTDFFT